jgi:hypothetical protein
MNEHHKSKRFQGVRADRTQNHHRIKINRADLGDRLTIKRSVRPRPVTVLRPGQELLICLGWLRLFQRIVAPELTAFPGKYRL